MKLSQEARSSPFFCSSSFVLSEPSVRLARILIFSEACGRNDDLYVVFATQLAAKTYEQKWYKSYTGSEGSVWRCVYGHMKAFVCVPGFVGFSFESVYVCLYI